MVIQSVSVVISTYNEGSRVVKVLEVLQKCKKIYEVIVVDDGSNARSRKYLDKAKLDFPKFIFLTHEKNQGKTAGLLTGFNASHGDHIFFLDADLVGLLPEHIDGMIQAYLDHDYTMVISNRKNALLFNIFSNMQIAFTGDRILSREFLSKHIDIFQNSGYLIESALNKIIFHNYSCAVYSFKKVSQTIKLLKTGFIPGSIQYLQMLNSQVKLLGWPEYFWQIRHIQKMKTIK